MSASDRRLRKAGWFKEVGRGLWRDPVGHTWHSKNDAILILNLRAGYITQERYEKEREVTNEGSGREE